MTQRRTVVRPVRAVEESGEGDAAYRAHIARLVDAAPPLTDEQRARLRVLLRGPAATQAAA